MIKPSPYYLATIFSAVSIVFIVCVCWIVGSGSSGQLRPPQKNISSDLQIAAGEPPSPPMMDEPDLQRKPSLPSRVTYPAQAKIAREIRHHGGGSDQLGKIEILQSDLVEFDNGSIQRQSIIKSSHSQDPILSIEHFDSLGVFTHSSFHSATRLAIRVADSLDRERVLASAKSMGYSVDTEPHWGVIIVLKKPATIKAFFAEKQVIERITGDSRSVLLTGVKPL